MVSKRAWKFAVLLEVTPVVSLLSFFCRVSYLHVYGWSARYSLCKLPVCRALNLNAGWANKHVAERTNRQPSVAKARVGDVKRRLTSESCEFELSWGLLSPMRLCNSTATPQSSSVIIPASYEQWRTGGIYVCTAAVLYRLCVVKTMHAHFKQTPT